MTHPEDMSRSMQRRLAAQKGQPAPDFSGEDDKMAKPQSKCGHTYHAEQGLPCPEITSAECESKQGATPRGHVPTYTDGRQLNCSCGTDPKNGYWVWCHLHAAALELLSLVLSLVRSYLNTYPLDEYDEDFEQRNRDIV